jgi:hypothetical protein
MKKASSGEVDATAHATAASVLSEAVTAQLRGETENVRKSISKLPTPFKQVFLGRNLGFPASATPKRKSLRSRANTEVELPRLSLAPDSMPLGDSLAPEAELLRESFAPDMVSLRESLAPDADLLRESFAPSEMGLLPEDEDEMDVVNELFSSEDDLEFTPAVIAHMNKHIRFSVGITENSDAKTLHTRELADTLAATCTQIAVDAYAIILEKQGLSAGEAYHEAVSECLSNPSAFAPPTDTSSSPNETRRRESLLFSLEKKTAHGNERDMDDIVASLTQDELDVIDEYANKIEATGIDALESYALALDSFVTGMHNCQSKARQSISFTDYTLEQQHESSLRDLFSDPSDYDLNEEQGDLELVEIYAGEMMVNAGIDSAIAYGVALDSFTADPVAFRRHVRSIYPAFKTRSLDQDISVSNVLFSRSKQTGVSEVPTYGASLRRLFQLPAAYQTEEEDGLDIALVEKYAEEIQDIAGLEESVAYGVALDSFISDPVQFRLSNIRLLKSSVSTVAKSFEEVHSEANLHKDDSSYGASLQKLFQMPTAYASDHDRDIEYVEKYARELQNNADIDEAVAYGIALDAFTSDPIEFRRRVILILNEPQAREQAACEGVDDEDEALVTSTAILGRKSPSGHYIPVDAQILKSDTPITSGKSLMAAMVASENDEKLMENDPRSCRTSCAAAVTASVEKKAVTSEGEPRSSCESPLDEIFKEAVMAAKEEAPKEAEEEETKPAPKSSRKTTVAATDETKLAPRSSRKSSVVAKEEAPKEAEEEETKPAPRSSRKSSVAAKKEASKETEEETKPTPRSSRKITVAARDEVKSVTESTVPLKRGRIATVLPIEHAMTRSRRGQEVVADTASELSEEKAPISSQQPLARRGRPPKDALAPALVVASNKNKRAEPMNHAPIFEVEAAPKRTKREEVEPKDTMEKIPSAVPALSARPKRAASMKK